MEQKTLTRRQCIGAIAAGLMSLVLFDPKAALAKPAIKCEEQLVRFWWSSKTGKMFQQEYQCIPYRKRLYHKNDDEVIDKRMGYDPDGNYCLLIKYYRRWYTE